VPLVQLRFRSATGLFKVHWFSLVRDKPQIQIFQSKAIGCIALLLREQMIPATASRRNPKGLRNGSLP
jgi:hypothetical protein